MICCPAAQPVWHWSNAISSDNEEGKVVLPQGGGEDNEKKADGEYLAFMLAVTEHIVSKAQM